MNKLFILLVLLLSMAFGSLFYLAKAGHGGDAFVGGFAGGTLGGVLGGAISNSANKKETREVTVIEKSSDSEERRLDRVEDELSELRKHIRNIEKRVKKLEANRERE